MPDTEPKKKAIEYEVPFRQALDDEMKTAKEDGDEDTATIIRRLKVREIKKLADESEKLDLEEAVETQRVRLRNLKTQKKGTSKAPNYVEAETGSQNTNVMKDLFGPESLKILRDMKEDDRNSLLRSVTMVTQGGTGKGLQGLMPFMFEAQKNVGKGGSDMDIVKAAKDLLGMYWQGRDEKEKELIALATSAPAPSTQTAAPKGFLEELLDDEVKASLKDNFKKLLSGKTESAPATAPQVTDSTKQPIRMIPDPERPGHYFPEIVPNLDEYYKLESRREEHTKKKADEEKSVKREDRLFNEVIKPIVKSGTKMIDEEVKKLRGGGAQSSEKSSASEDAKTTSPPQEQSFPCPDTEKCKGTITIKAVNGKWPETATCPTCKQSWKPQE